MRDYSKEIEDRIKLAIQHQSFKIERETLKLHKQSMKTNRIIAVTGCGLLIVGILEFFFRYMDLNLISGTLLIFISGLIMALILTVFVVFGYLIRDLKRE